MFQQPPTATSIQTCFRFTLESSPGPRHRFPCTAQQLAESLLHRTAAPNADRNHHHHNTRKMCVCVFGTNKRSRVRSLSQPPERWNRHQDTKTEKSLQSGAMRIGTEWGSSKCLRTIMRWVCNSFLLHKKWVILVRAIFQVLCASKRIIAMRSNKTRKFNAFRFGKSVGFALHARMSIHITQHDGCLGQTELLVVSQNHTHDYPPMICIVIVVVVYWMY